MHASLIICCKLYFTAAFVWVLELNETLDIQDKQGKLYRMCNMAAVLQKTILNFAAADVV